MTPVEIGALVINGEGVVGEESVNWKIGRLKSIRVGSEPTQETVPGRLKLFRENSEKRGMKVLLTTTTNRKP